ncbi:hypothetical protein [Streptomyces viridochromogenes]|uniref:hypothetical protein n=1 Tax=Streptomyces viridochromogenes TaxID=1938 RepID=UPI00069E3BD5|nr:hypothetical protein [Streptomyces viridochromogenes]KOG21166.1 membrane protein [Streptomyces viridochromogenes]KOG22853.1 membrane protein [Streptomyces viridochromogenes]
MLTRLRNALSAALIALSCLLVPFGALAAWVTYGLADTGRYITAMAPLAADPAVQGAVADTVGAGIMREIDHRMKASAASPTSPESPEPPEPDTVRPFAQDAVRSFTRTEAFRTAWEAGNRVVHDAVLSALQDGRERAVTVDLAPVTAQIKRQLTDSHVPLAHHIPVEHTEVALLPAHEVHRLRKGYEVLEVAGFWLPVAAAVLASAGIAVAACRRRAVTATALGSALGGAFLLLAVAIGRRLTLADLPDPAHRPAAGAIYDALTATLRNVSWLLIVLGLTVALTCRLAHLLAQHRRVCATPTADPAREPNRARA